MRVGSSKIAISLLSLGISSEPSNALQDSKATILSYCNVLFLSGFSQR